MFEYTLKAHCLPSRLNPRIIHNPGNRPGTLRWATDLFQDEIQALIDCRDLTRTPDLLDESVQAQDNQYEYPGGYLQIIAMSRMPGKPVTEYFDLSDFEGLHIKRELIEILEWVPTIRHPEFS